MEYSIDFKDFTPTLITKMNGGFYIQGPILEELKNREIWCNNGETKNYSIHITQNLSTEMNDFLDKIQAPILERLIEEKKTGHSEKMKYYSTDLRSCLSPKLNDFLDKIEGPVLEELLKMDKKLHTKKMKHVFDEISGLVYSVPSGVFSGLPQGGIGYR